MSKKIKFKVVMGESKSKENFKGKEHNNYLRVAQVSI